MNESDTSKILGVQAGPEEDRRSSDLTEEPEGPIGRSPPFRIGCSAVTVEPVIFLSMFSVAMSGPLSTQYLWDRISRDLGYDGSETSWCGNASVPADPLQKVFVKSLG